MADDRRPQKKNAAPDAADALRQPPSAEELRRQAEEHLDGLSVAAPAAVHELRVHQIELEMQNEELRRVQLELDAQRAKYFELFDLAPVGYLSMSDEGIVGEANFTAASLLDVERRQLIGKPFIVFIFTPDRDMFYRHLESLRQTGAPQTCALRLRRAGDRVGASDGAAAAPSHFWARLESRPQRAAGGETLFFRTTFADVTESKRAEEALRRRSEEVANQQELLATLLDTIPSPVFYKDADGVYLGCNQAFERLLGRERDEIVGKTAADLGPPEIAERYDAMDLRLLEQAGTQTYERPLETADGSLREVVFNKATFKGSDGQVAGLIGVILDITERKRVEEELKESELNFRAVFDTVDDVIVVGTPDGRLVYANPAASARLGYSTAEIAGMRMLDLYPAENRGEAAAMFAGVSWGDREICPLPLQSKSRALVPVETRVWLGRWDGAECIFAVSKDLIKEQEALQKFDWLFRSNPALTAVSSLPDRRFTEVNEAFLNALGYSREEMLGHTSEELGLFVEPDQRRAVAGQLQAQGRVSDYELKVRCKDGTILDGLYSGEIIESQGRQYFLTVMIDQTERKRAEDALRRSEHALQSALDGLAASIVVLDERGTILLVNRTWQEFAEQNGLAAGSVSAGANYLQVCDAATGEHSAEAAAFAAGIRAVLSAETDSYVVEYPCHAPDKKRWFAGRVTVFPSEGPQRVVVAHEDITARKQAERQLKERVKELQGLYGLAEIAEREGLTLDELYQELTDILPKSWQYPEIACARTVIGEREFRTHDFTESAWIQSAPVKVSGSAVGRIDVGYREEMPQEDEGPFLKEERRLLDALAERLGAIIARQQAEKALRESEQRFRLITEAIDEAFWMADVEIGKIFYVSPSFERIWGLSRESLYEDPRSFLEAVHVEDRERVLAELEIEKTGQPFNHEYRIIQPDGTTRHIWDRGFPVRDEKGAVSSYAGVAMDITERKRAGEALQESEQNFRAFFETVDDIIAVAALDGRLVYANPAASAKLGYNATELAVMQRLDLYPAEKRGEADAIFAALLRGEGETCPLPLQTKSGALLPVETRVWSGRWDDAECVFGVSKDLTMEQEALRYARLQLELNERRQAEKALLRSARELHEQLLDTVKTMGAIVGLRDPYTAAHERRVTELATAIALELGLGEEALEGLAFAGEVHDIGKVGVPAEILSKPAALNEEEFSLIKRHAQAGRELLGAIRFRQPVAEIVGQHHERLDGTGYPDGLKGDEIMREARILAVADVVEAMASHRPYRAGLGLEAALAEVRSGSGVRYDADVVATCERVFAQGFTFSEP